MQSSCHERRLCLAHNWYLVQEFAAWFRNLALQGVVPRTFTGVTRDGKQAIVILTGLPLDHMQRRDFVIWLCRTEGFVAYAYGTHVGIAADSASALAEGIDIYASSDRYDASKTLGIDRLTGGTLKIVEHNLAVMPASPENGIFLGQPQSQSQEQVLKRAMWVWLGPVARRAQLTSSRRTSRHSSARLASSRGSRAYTRRARRRRQKLVPHFLFR